MRLNQPWKVIYLMHLSDQIPGNSLKPYILRNKNICIADTKLSPGNLEHVKDKLMLISGGSLDRDDVFQSLPYAVGSCAE